MEPRLSRILDIVRAERLVTVPDLSRRLGVSQATIRHDLNALAAAGKIQRTRGGALALESPEAEEVLPYAVGARLMLQEKRAIARAACELVESGDTIVLDASSTVCMLARLLKARHDLRITVITNGLSVINELADATHVQLVAIGGSFDRESASFIGPLAESTLRGLRALKAFISPKGITSESGLTDWNPLTASIRKTMIAISDEIVVLADHSKWSRPYPYPIASLNEVQHIISDKNLSPNWQKQLRAASLEISMVTPAAEEEG